MLECRTKCPTENDEKKQNSSDHKGTTIRFYVISLFLKALVAL